MALADLGMPVDFCAFTMALYDTSTHQAIAGPLRGYASDEPVSFSPTEEFTGGEDQSKENGCGKTTFTRETPRTLKWAKGNLVVNRAHPEWDALLTGAGLYVPSSGAYTGKTTGWSGTPDSGKKTYAWVTLYYGLEIDEQRSTIATKNAYRAFHMPKCTIQPKHSGGKKGPHDFSYDITAYPDRPTPAALAKVLVNCTTNSTITVTVSSTAGLAVGQGVSGAGIPIGASIASITNGTTFTLSAAATTSVAGTLTLTFAQKESTYTGPFAELPADYWAQVTQTSWSYAQDVLALPNIDTLTLITTQ